jgi:hypothetical protein
MLNKTPIRWISKRQKTEETSTYGSELVASRVATELILEIRYMLRSFGVALTKTLSNERFDCLMKRWLFRGPEKDK